MAACQWLLKENNPVYKVDEDDASTSIEEVTPTPNAGIVEEEAFSFSDVLDSSAETAAKEKEKTASDYVNTDHLLASAAIVECLRSKFDALVPQRREGMSPLLIMTNAEHDDMLRHIVTVWMMNDGFVDEALTLRGI